MVHAHFCLIYLTTCYPRQHFIIFFFQAHRISSYFVAFLRFLKNTLPVCKYHAMRCFLERNHVPYVWCPARAYSYPGLKQWRIYHQWLRKILPVGPGLQFESLLYRLQLPRFIIKILLNHLDARVSSSEKIKTKGSQKTLDS